MEQMSQILPMKTNVIVKTLATPYHRLKEVQCQPREIITSDPYLPIFDPQWAKKSDHIAAVQGVTENKNILMTFFCPCKYQSKQCELYCTTRCFDTISMSWILNHELYSASEFFRKWGWDIKKNLAGSQHSQDGESSFEGKTTHWQLTKRFVEKSARFGDKYQRPSLIW